MIRAFIAVDIDPQTVKKISAALVQLKPRVPGIRWGTLTNCHFTLKFLGDIEETKVDSIANALEFELRPFPRFTINAKGLGVFPHVKRPRVLWIGLEGKELEDLASKVEKAMEPLGFMPEKREFKPHLTVGRWREFVGSAKILGEELERWKSYEFGESTVAEVIFFQSVLEPHGATYHTLKIVTLAN